MRIFIVSIFVSIFVSIPFLHSIPSAIAQSVWQEVGSCQFRGIQKLPSGRIVMVTSGGDLYSSTDDGASWQIDTINPAMLITSVSFYDDLHGIAGAGSTKGSAIEVTSDGGRTWVTDTSSIISGILSVSAPSLDTLYTSHAPHSAILRSTDRGSTWDSIPVPTTAQIWNVKFLTAKEGYAFGTSGFLAHTTDAGETWTTLPTGISGQILSLDIRGSRLAIGSDIVPPPVGDAAIIGLSSDQGKHWKYVAFSDNAYSPIANPANAAEDSLFGPMSVVRFVNSDTIIGFESGNFWRFQTTNFGSSWSWSRISPDYVHESYDGSTLSDGFVDGQGNGLICGHDGTLYRLAGHGLDGHIQSYYGVGSPTIEAMPDNNNLIHGVGGLGRFCVSSDGGLTWYSRPGASGGYAFYGGLHFTSADSGIIFSDLGLYTDFWPFQATTDDGADWNSLNVGRFSRLGRVIHGQDGQLYIVGDSTVIRSTDQGYTWQTYKRFWITTSPEGPGQKVLWTIIQNGAFLPNGHASLLVYEMDSVFNPTPQEQYGFEPVFSVISTSDDGQTWSSPQVLTQNVYLWGMAFVNQNLGYIGGGNDGDSTMLFRTTNGGVSWSNVHGFAHDSQFATDRIIDMAFNSTGSIGLITGDYGLLLESYDSGWTWNAIDARCPTGTPSEFFRPYFLNDSVALVQSLHEGFWKKEFSLSSSRAYVSEGPANQYLFLSSYPSPTSGIVHCDAYGLYSLQSQSSISCKMTDILGRTVMDLTPLIQQADNGAYAHFTFNTNTLANGIYLLTLQTDAGSRTEQIVVLH